MTPIFNRRLLRWLIGLALFSFGIGILLSILGPSPVVRSAESDSFSRSAVGHHALLQTLKRLKIPVVISRGRTAAKAANSGLLLLLEPLETPKSIQHARDLIREGRPTLLVLPKWQAWADRAKPEWVGSSRLRPVAQVNHLLDELNINAQVTRASSVSSWSGESDPTFTHPVQLLQGGVEYLGSPQGTLISHDRRLTIISDPDLLNNMGLGQGHNAEIVLKTIEMAAHGETLLIDEVLHGYTANESVFRALFEFPLVLALGQALLVVTLLFWAAMRRFGAPQQPESTLGRGRFALIENTASLLEFGGHGAFSLERYWQGTIRDVRAALHVPKDLSHAEALIWLHRVGQSRGVALNPHQINEYVTQASQPTAMLTAARHAQTWRTDILQTHLDKAL